MNRYFLRLACLGLVLALGPGCDSENPVDPGPDGNPPAGPSTASIQGTVSIGDSPVQGIQVSLSGPAANRTARTVADGSFAFTDLPLGAYSVTAVVAGATCNSATVDVQAGQTSPVSIACDLPGSIVGTVSVGGMPIGMDILNGRPTQIAEVVLSGPAGVRTTSTGTNGRFVFGSLPPGSYTLTATVHETLFVSSFPCESISLTVQGSESATANISCTGPRGTIGGQVTINGEARPIVWVELQLPNGFPWAFGTTIPSGSWEFREVPAGDYVVVIKTPPGLTCDATYKSTTVRGDQPAIVNFACVGDVKGSIQGFTSSEFGTYASARVTLTGPLNLETISNADGFFAFEDLPAGDYVLRFCHEQSVTVQEGVPAFVGLDCS